MTKEPCDRCGRRSSTLYALMVPEARDKSLCRHCQFVVRFERDRRIEREMERRAFLKDETWSLASTELSDVVEFDKREWNEAAAEVDLVAMRELLP